jgi:hypothetical protein
MLKTRQLCERHFSPIFRHLQEEQKTGLLRLITMARYTFAAAIGFLVCTGAHSQQTTTKSIASVYLPNADQFAYGVMGSIVSADANKTALQLACPPGTTLCGQYMYGSTVTYGPTTFIYDDPLRTYTQPDVKSVVQW